MEILKGELLVGECKWFTRQTNLEEGTMTRNFKEIRY